MTSPDSTSLAAPSAPSPAPASRSTPPPTVSEAIDLLPRVGLNWGAWGALLLAFFFANYDISVFAITLPAMRESLDLVGDDLAWPVTWNLIGYSVGATVFGYVADKWGRQKGLFLTFAILAIGGFASGFAWDVASLSAFRFLAGGGMGAVLALCAAYIGEMVPLNRRGQYLTRIYIWTGLGQLLVGFASLPILASMPELGWRGLLIFGGLVFVILPFINRKHVTESPRWLAERGQHELAEDITRRMQRHAKVEETPVFSRDAIVEDKGAIRELFKGELLRRLAVVLGFWFIFYTAMYGFSSYLPLLLEGIGVSTSDAIFVTVLTRIAPIISAVALLPFIERVERRTLIIIGTLIFAVGVALIIVGWGDVAATAGSILATFGIMIMATPAYTYTAEVFPTRNRSTAAAICDGVGHLGGAVAPFVVLPVLIGAGAVPAGILMIVLLIVAAGLLGFGPRTKNKALEEIAA
ncbi:MFS transporter, putative metabolite:H+ symporter [Agrococcus baldri]|uniref:MFS transporter, putative metabolite:H+ symporter n=1 Tax=Agrococcus baldri TaxID=153730 RepID=A0AA94KZQ3_9MICO|nr:MFS transporter [Agrococcus baldri]SFS11493.1 MFS transporter, putative metabolite:H+ symporter [Agrococcus baldri]